MKTILIFLASIFILTCCVNSRKVVLDSGFEFWSEHHAGDTTTLHTEYTVYAKGSDTIIHFTNYYQNGGLKSKIIMYNEELREIEFVLDTLGNKLDFGKLKKGNGYVIQFRDDGIGRDQEGLYVNGNREGWWKRYHYTGTIIDSTIYVGGFPQYPKPTNSLESLLELFGPLKNNFYD